MTTGNRKTSNNRNRNKSNSNSRKRQTKKERMAEIEKTEAFRTEVILWIIVAVSLLLFISNMGFGGVVGRGVSHILFGLFGLMAYVLPVLLLVGSFFAVSNKGNFHASVKLLAGSIFALFMCMFMSLAISSGEVLDPIQAFTYCADRKNGGGIVGGFLAFYLVKAFGFIGSYIIDIIVLIVCLVLITEKSALKGMQKGGQKVYESAKENNERYKEYREYKAQERQKRRMDHKVSGVSIDTKIEGKKSKNKKSDELGEITDTQDLPKVKKSDKIALSADSQETVASDVSKVEPVFAGEIFPPAEPVISGDFVEDDVPLAKEEVSTVPAKQKVETTVPEQEPSTVKTAKKKVKPSEAEVADGIAGVVQEMEQMQPLEHKYEYPPIDLLKAGSGKKSANTESQLRETANKLQQTLKTFGVNVTVTNISCGPAVTRYEIQPEMGVKVSKIVGLADDIKLNLAATDIRIEAPIPGKAAIGIEVPNKENTAVGLRELLETDEFKKFPSNIAFAVGKDIAGRVVVSDIAKMPHMLIAGATGSGKSVCINTLIMSILYKADPSDVKLIMVDPKVVELSVYNGIPHLMIPVVTDPKKASAALQWGVAEMTDRYQRFADFNVRDLKGYNKKVEDMVVRGDPQAPKKMPQIVIIVDELADLMMVSPGEVEESICRLAQLARAAGIHLIIATQRPSVDVITGLIKANMPSRIAFSVSSGVDSRTILDMNGAEKLLGKGDMLFYPQGYTKPVRVQGAFVSDKEVSDVVEFLKNQQLGNIYDSDIQQKMESMGAASGDGAGSPGGGNERDQYFVDAAQFIIEKDKASIGMLQRVFKIGFNRAARIMDQLCEAGVVGEEEGTKPRKVLMSQEQFEQYIEECL